MGIIIIQSGIDDVKRLPLKRTVGGNSQFGSLILLFLTQVHLRLNVGSVEVYGKVPEDLADLIQAFPCFELRPPKSSAGEVLILIKLRFALGDLRLFDWGKDGFVKKTNRKDLAWTRKPLETKVVVVDFR